MNLHIRDAETNKMVERLAALRHQTKTEVVKRAIERELQAELKAQQQSGLERWLDDYLKNPPILPPYRKEESDALFEDMNL